MNLKRNIVLMSALAVLILGSTAMISRSDVNESDKVVPEKKITWQEKGRKLVHKKLTTPLAKKYKVNLKRRVISRCPSGLRYRLKDYTVKKGNYFYGQMKKYSGCSGGKLICKFRVNAAQNQVQVLDEKTNQYTSHNQWLSAHAGPQKVQRMKRY